jgi:hypothetical protein
MGSCGHRRWHFYRVAIVFFMAAILATPEYLRNYRPLRQLQLFVGTMTRVLGRAIARRDGIFFVNPGSAGPRRFKLPISVADILIEGGAISPRIVELEMLDA